MSIRSSLKRLSLTILLRKIFCSRETEYFRIRVGDYRIIYGVDDELRLVKVLSIAHRRDVYR
jgi:mRNA-degrading endonuclease RelE of RelBE toxin-antitoxin system